ncbi:MAG: LysR family transcriptional regulator [Burkholderiaceae bacterium]|nr:LysR family transcriptional regulator [Burkholderiaceae bacterium]
MVMRFEGLDLNLLVALKALLEERSVSKAAERMHTSQPAMSAALSKLREYFNDELLIRTGREMAPTAQAEYLLRPIAEVLGAIQQAMKAKPAFNPREADRVFRITMSDYMASILLPRLLLLVRQEAPGIRIEVLPSDLLLLTRLERGEIDLAICPEKYLSEAHPSALLTQDDYVVVVDQENPCIAYTITLDQYLDMDHVVVNLSNDRSASFEDWFLEHFNIRRKYAVSVPLFSLVPSLIVNTPLIATMHTLLAKQLARHFRIRLVSVPQEFPALREHMQWHRLRDHDLGLAWLRKQLSSITKEMH